MPTKKIVTIGGGKGQSALLTQIKNISHAQITSLVSVFDNGGSSGVLRKKFNILPPGDILKCMLALSDSRDLANIFLKRFSNGKFKNHNLGNLLINSLTQYTGNFAQAIQELNNILNLRGQVFPITTSNTDLIAELKNGKLIHGETKIDTMSSKNSPIKKIFLESKQVRIYPPARQAINKANYIILAPGDLYTSLLPNLLVTGTKSALQKTKAKIIYILNAQTKPGETDNFTSLDFTREVQKYLGRKIDYILIGKTRKKNTKIVQHNLKNFPGRIKIINGNLILDNKSYKHDFKSLIRFLKKY